MRTTIWQVVKRSPLLTACSYVFRLWRTFVYMLQRHVAYQMALKNDWALPSKVSAQSLRRNETPFNKCHCTAYRPFNHSSKWSCFSSLSSAIILLSLLSWFWYASIIFELIANSSLSTTFSDELAQYHTTLEDKAALITARKVLSQPSKSCEVRISQFRDPSVVIKSKILQKMALTPLRIKNSVRWLTRLRIWRMKSEKDES